MVLMNVSGCDMCQIQRGFISKLFVLNYCFLSYLATEGGGHPFSSEMHHFFLNENYVTISSVTDIFVAISLLLYLRVTKMKQNMHFCLSQIKKSQKLPTGKHDYVGWEIIITHRGFGAAFLCCNWVQKMCSLGTF